MKDLYNRLAYLGMNEHADDAEPTLLNKYEVDQFARKISCTVAGIDDGNRECFLIFLDYIQEKKLIFRYELKSRGGNLRKNTVIVDYADGNYQNIEGLYQKAVKFTHKRQWYGSMDAMGDVCANVQYDFEIHRRSSIQLMTKTTDIKFTEDGSPYDTIFPIYISEIKPIWMKRNEQFFCDSTVMNDLTIIDDMLSSHQAFPSASGDFEECIDEGYVPANSGSRVSVFDEIDKDDSVDAMNVSGFSNKIVCYSSSWNGRIQHMSVDFVHYVDQDKLVLYYVFDYGDSGGMNEVQRVYKYSTLNGDDMKVFDAVRGATVSQTLDGSDGFLRVTVKHVHHGRRGIYPKDTVFKFCRQVPGRGVKELSLTPPTRTRYYYVSGRVMPGFGHVSDDISVLDIADLRKFLEKWSNDDRRFKESLPRV